MANDVIQGGERNDVIQGVGGDDTIAGVGGIFAGAANDVLQGNLAYTENVQKRRTVWSELAQELGIDEKMVNVTNTGINIEGVANFELSDSEDATYKELEKGEKGGFTGLPKQDIWEKFTQFISNWSRTQQETFLTQVMGMNTPKKGDWNFYLSASPPYTGRVHGLYIGRVLIDSYWGNMLYHQYSVRRVQN